jgi:large subunit ribosomal protein L5
MNSMLTPRIAKVTINMGVGKSGEPLDKAVKVMTMITEQTPVKTKTSKRIPAFDLRPGMLIGCKVTLRGKKAASFLKKALDAVDYKLRSSNFDNTGNFAFGLKEHIDLEGMRYDPNLGVYGMNVCVTLERPGYRVSIRKKKKSIGKKHRLTKEEAMEFAKKIGAKIE